MNGGPPLLSQRGRTTNSFIISYLIYSFNQFIKLVVRDSIIMFGSEASPKHFAKQNISHCVSNISHASAYITHRKVNITALPPLSNREVEPPTTLLYHFYFLLNINFLILIVTTYTRVICACSCTINGFNCVCIGCALLC